MEDLYVQSKYSEAVFPERGGLPSVALIGIGNHRQSTSALVPHRHLDALEIVYLQKGHQIYDVEGTEYHLYGGHLFVTPPDLLHSTGQYPEDKSSFVWIQIDLSERRHFLGLEEPMASELFEALCQMKTSVFRAPAVLAWYLETAVFTVREGKPLWRAKTQNLVLSFLYTVLEKAGEADKSRPTEDILKCLEMMEAVFPKEAAIGELARVAGLSESRLRQKFKAQVGIPPGEFVCRRRIEEAARQITDTDRTFSEIALSLGFETGDYFARMFKKYTSKTPSQYRRNHGIQSRQKDAANTGKNDLGQKMDKNK